MNSRGRGCPFPCSWIKQGQQFKVTDGWLVKERERKKEGEGHSKREERKMVHFVEWKVAVIRSNSLMKNLTVIPLKRKGEAILRKKTKLPPICISVCLYACIYESNQHPYLYLYLFLFLFLFLSLRILMAWNLPPTTRIEFSSFKIIERGMNGFFFLDSVVGIRFGFVWCTQHRAMQRKRDVL